MKFFSKGKGSNNSTTSNMTNSSTNNNSNNNNKKIPSEDKVAENIKTSVEEGLGRAHSGLGVLRQTNSVFQYICIALLIAICWQDYNWRVFAEELAQKQWMIIHDNCGETQIKDFTAFQTGASDVQIKRMAWDMVNWIRSAGTNNVDTQYKQAIKFMTDKMKEDLYRTLEKRRIELQTLNIYFSVENQFVRQMKNEDLPIEARNAGMKAGRYDVYVKATFTAIREGTKEVIGTKDYTYWVRLIPLSRPTMENPMALLVDHMIELQDRLASKDSKDSLTQNLNKDNKDSKEKENDQ